MGVEKHINTSSIFEAIIQCQQNKTKKKKSGSYVELSYAAKVCANSCLPEAAHFNSANHEGSNWLMFGNDAENKGLLKSTLKNALP